MYAPDTAVIATPIGMIRITGGEHALWSVAIEADGSSQSARSEIVRKSAEQITPMVRHYSAGAGVSTRQWLLDHEQRRRRNP